MIENVLTKIRPTPYETVNFFKCGVMNPKLLGNISTSALHFDIINFWCDFWQIALACKIQKPMVLREKGAHEDMIEILQKYKEMLPTLVLHSFIGTSEEASSYLQLDNLYIAVSGICFAFSCFGLKQTAMQTSPLFLCL